MSRRPSRTEDASRLQSLHRGGEARREAVAEAGRQPSRSPGARSVAPEEARRSPGARSVAPEEAQAQAQARRASKEGLEERPSKSPGARAAAPEEKRPGAQQLTSTESLGLVPPDRSGRLGVADTGDGRADRIQDTIGGLNFTIPEPGAEEEAEEEGSEEAEPPPQAATDELREHAAEFKEGQMALQQLGISANQLAIEETLRNGRLISSFRSWKALFMVTKRIEEELMVQERQDCYDLCRRFVRAWRSVFEIAPATTKKKGRLRRYSINPLSDGRARPLPRYLGDRKDAPQLFRQEQLHEVSGIAAHRPYIGLKMLIDVRNTLTCRVTLVAWRAMSAVEHALARQKDQRDVKHKGWGRKQWAKRAETVWRARRLRKKCLLSWYWHLQRVYPEECYMLCSDVWAQRWAKEIGEQRRQLALDKFFHYWAQEVWKVCATEILHNEREELTAAVTMRRWQVHDRRMAQQERVARAALTPRAATPASDLSEVRDDRKFRMPPSRRAGASSDARRGVAASSDARGSGRGEPGGSPEVPARTPLTKPGNVSAAERFSAPQAAERRSEPGAPEAEERAPAPPEDIRKRRLIAPARA